jgi:hypothetical protein
VRSLDWQGFSDQGRFTGAAPEQLGWDATATLRSQPARHLDGLVAFGEQRTGGLEVTWQLCTSADWRAERLDVRVLGRGGGSGSGGEAFWNRTLLLERSPGGWRSQAWTGRGDGSVTRSDPESPAAAIRDQRDGVLSEWFPGLPGGRLDLSIADVVMDSCPLSHWAPVRRLGLAGPRPSVRRGGPVRPLATAHPVLRVRLPDLAVVVTRQRYVGVGCGSDRTLEHSFAGGAAVPLVVDDSGVPVRFDGLVRRSDTAMVA